MSLYRSNQDMQLPLTDFPRCPSSMCHRDVKKLLFGRCLFNKIKAFLAVCSPAEKEQKGTGGNTSKWSWGYIIQAQRLLGILIQRAPAGQEKTEHQGSERTAKTLRESENMALALTMMQYGCFIVTLFHQEKKSKSKWNVNSAKSRFQECR